MIRRQAGEVTSAIATVADPARRRVRLGPWSRFVLRRTARALGAMFTIVTVSFVVLRASGGDPVRSALGPTASPELVAERRAMLGLDQPLRVQFIDYLVGLLHGDLGTSLISGRSVSELVATRLPGTLELAALAFLAVLLSAIPLGLWVAVKTSSGRVHGREFSFTAVTGILAAIPDYLLGVFLVTVFGVTLAWLPVAGKSGPASYVLPVLALALGATASLARIARVETLRTLRDDYVRTARSKRLPTWRVYTRHVLPNMLTAVLTLGGTLLATMITGTVLVEQVFNWPGMGTAFTTAILTRDYGIVQGLALVYAAIVLVVNLVVDVVIAIIDRRSTLVETS